MSEPFLSEIRVCSFGFAPKAWAVCDGQLLPINQNQSLYALLGTTYGGDGQSTFALPDLRGRVPIHRGDGRVLGESGGQESHALTTSEIPGHTHILSATSAQATTDLPATNAVPAVASLNLYGPVSQPVAAMNPGMLGNTGSAQPHENMQPYLVLNFCIALQGITPK